MVVLRMASPCSFSAPCSHSASSPVYCGVKPHLDATLTISNAFPWYSESDRSRPSMSWAEKS